MSDYSDHMKAVLCTLRMRRSQPISAAAQPSLRCGIQWKPAWRQSRSERGFRAWARRAVAGWVSRAVPDQSSTWARVCACALLSHYSHHFYYRLWVIDWFIYHVCAGGVRARAQAPEGLRWRWGGAGGRRGVRLSIRGAHGWRWGGWRAEQSAMELRGQEGQTTNTVLLHRNRCHAHFYSLCIQIYSAALTWRLVHGAKTLKRQKYKRKT